MTLKISRKWETENPIPRPHSFVIEEQWEVAPSSAFEWNRDMRSAAGTAALFLQCHDRCIIDQLRKNKRKQNHHLQLSI